jgi:hypothetical protein
MLKPSNLGTAPSEMQAGSIDTYLMKAHHVTEALQQKNITPSAINNRRTTSQISENAQGQSQGINNFTVDIKTERRDSSISSRVYHTPHL